MHAFLMLSTVALYREYMAFSPWRVTTPQGPLDEPKLTEKPPEGGPNYWVEQACECFGAVNEFASILQACQAQNLIVESPIAGFATYLVAWCGRYCRVSLEIPLTWTSSLLSLLPPHGSEACVEFQTPP
jgi:hypothetical protein